MAKRRGQIQTTDEEGKRNRAQKSKQISETCKQTPSKKRWWYVFVLFSRFFLPCLFLSRFFSSAVFLRLSSISMHDMASPSNHHWYMRSTYNFAIKKTRERERRPQRARKWYEQLTTRHGLHRGREKNRYPSERKMKFSSCPFWVVSITLESSADRREVFNWLDEIKKRLDHFFFQAYLGRRFAREHNKHVLLSRRFSAHSRLCSRPVRMPYVRQKSDTTSRSSVDKANSRFFLSLIQT